MRQAINRIVLIITGLMVAGCAAKTANLSDPSTLYISEDIGGLGAKRYVPAFIVDGGDEFNKIGKPSARQEAPEEEPVVFVDEKRPAIYHLEKEFRTEKGAYRNHVYRVHFKGIPFSIIPFHLTYGKNTGIMVVVTTDLKDTPLLVTTVHTCGCYMSIVPTTELDPACLPDGWTGEPLDVYGETLPGQLDFAAVKRPLLVVGVREDTHRIRSLAVRERADFIRSQPDFLRTPVFDMERLENLKTPFETTSFYYEKGRKKGFVKDSEKIWETLFMGLISCDFYVGTDKIYGEKTKTVTPFYTSLKFWARSDSDMWDFARFLKYWGWKL